MIENERQYSLFAQVLRQHRSIKYRSARAFLSTSNLDLSYPQYSRYESGDQLPTLPQAMAIFKLLGVALQEWLLLWCQAQVEGKENRDAIEALKVGQKASSSNVTSDRQPVSNIDRALVFNRAHLQLFQSDLRYRDIFTYVNACAPIPVGLNEVTRALGISREEADLMCRKLGESGVILYEEGELKVGKQLFYFPDDEDFFQLRNSNVIHNVQSVLSRVSFPDLRTRRAFRTVATRELSKDQAAEVTWALERLAHQMLGMPEVEDASDIYSMSLVFGPRFGKMPALPRSEPRARLS